MLKKGVSFHWVLVAVSGKYIDSFLSGKEMNLIFLAKGVGVAISFGDSA